MKKMLEGIRTRSLKRRPDERGIFTEIMRSDWSELTGEDELAQANLSISYPGIIRAWHRHVKGQVDYFVALKGSVKICAYDDKSEELDEIITTGKDLQVVRIPGRYWHGFKVIGNKPAWVLYFVNKLYDYDHPDEERRPWNDPSVIPKIINGRMDDPRINKTWNWNYPPHR